MNPNDNAPATAPTPYARSGTVSIVATAYGHRLVIAKACDNETADFIIRACNAHAKLVALLAERDYAEAELQHTKAALAEAVQLLECAYPYADGEGAVELADRIHRFTDAALLRELQDVRKAAGPGEPLSGVVASLRDERDRLLEALHACFAAAKDTAVNLDDFRALQHREQAVIEAVRTLRKNHDEIADRLWKALTP